MTTKTDIRNQFNRQAQQFSKHELTKNRKLFEFTWQFCRMSGKDTLLDVACGSGDFINFCAARIHHAVGCDLSDELLKLAIHQARQNRLGNTLFCLGDSEATPFADGTFSIASCRSAFHHMENYRQVFKEMMRAVQVEGKICLQDMVTYENPEVNRYFEALDKAIDTSHQKALSEEQILSLYKDNGLRVDNKVCAEQAFHLEAYIGHAHQSDADKRRIKELIDSGWNDPGVSRYFFHKNDELYFKKNGIIVVGSKS